MRKFIIISLAIFMQSAALGQDYIERNYFPGARAKNAAVAAARYAEESYYYSKFTTHISALDSSRMYADTALFFIKRALMLGDTSLSFAGSQSREAVDFLREGHFRILAADSIIRGFYPMVDVASHNYFGNEACFHLSNGVMDFFNASLLLRSEKDAPDSEAERYSVLPFAEEIVRLQADETSFQHISNEYEEQIERLERLSSEITAEVAATPDQKTRAELRSWYDDVQSEIAYSTKSLQDASSRIMEIRFLLDRKYLEDVKNVADPEHLTEFEVEGQPSSEIAMNEDIPDGLLYKIQLGYYPVNVDINNFHGLFPITGETVRGDLARYYAGMFYTYSEASKGNDYVRKNAIANAFVVPFHNGKKISVSRAIELERSRGVR